VNIVNYTVDVTTDIEINNLSDLPKLKLLMENLNLNTLNILTLVVQTKAMVCATIFYSRSEGRSNNFWDRNRVRIINRPTSHPYLNLFSMLGPRDRVKENGIDKAM
jgi:hypothetical protein